MAIMKIYSTSNSLCLSLTLLSIVSFSFFFFFFLFATSNKNPTSSYHHHQQQLRIQNPNSISIKVYVADLPRSYNYDLINQYWASTSPDSRLPSDPDHQTRHPPSDYPKYPENPVIKQYSAEYWLLSDLETPENLRSDSFAKRVFDDREADVVFVPFFATLSAEMELAKEKSMFKKKGDGNEDYKRQKEVIDFVMNSEAWKRSGGRDHVFVLTAL